MAWTHEDELIYKAYCADILFTAEEMAEYETCKGDWEAERAAEAYFENRGYDEARLQEAMEAQFGVVPFDVAMGKGAC